MSASSVQSKLLQTALASAGLLVVVALGNVIPGAVHALVRREFAGRACFGFVRDLAKMARAGEPLRLGTDPDSVKELSTNFGLKAFEGFRADRVLRESAPGFHSVCSRMAHEVYERCRHGKSARSGRFGVDAALECAQDQWFSSVYEGRLMPYVQWRWNQDKAVDLASFDGTELERTTRVPGRTPSSLTAEEQTPVSLRPAEPFPCSKRNLESCHRHSTAAFSSWKADTLPDPLLSSFRDACASGDAFSCIAPELITGIRHRAAPRDSARMLRQLRDQCERRKDPYSCTALAYADDPSEARSAPPLREKALDRGCRLEYGYACTLLGLEIRKRLDQKGFSPEALSFFELGCKNRDPSGCHGVGLMRAWKEDFSGAASAYARACEMGSPGACKDLGKLELLGKGAPWSRVKARRHFRLACETRSSQGCFELAYLHETGVGADLDTTAADQLYTHACELGLRSACKRVGLDDVPSDADYDSPPSSGRAPASAPTLDEEEDQEGE